MLQRLCNTEALTEKGHFETSIIRTVALIGTIHLDTDAATPLMTLLEQLEPSCIAVEISRFSVAFRTEHQEFWLKKFNTARQSLPSYRRYHFRMELLKRQLNMPFEWQTACAYANRSQIPCIAIDSSDIARQELPTWEQELINENNLLLATSEPDQPLTDYFAKHYRQALRYLTGRYGHNDRFLGLVFDDQWCKREEIIASRLLNLASQYRDVAYIGGWMHLLQEHSVFTLANLARAAIKERFLLTGQTVHKL